MTGMPTRYAQARVSPGSPTASRGRKPGADPSRHSPFQADQPTAALDGPCARPSDTHPTCLPPRRASPQSPCPARTRATTAPMHSLCACRTRSCSTRLDRRRRRRERICLRCDHCTPRNRAPCPCGDVGCRRFGRRTRKADAVGTTAVPFVVLDIESDAGGDELLDHEREAVRRGRDERSVPAEKSVTALNSVRPMQSAQRPYPSLFWTSSPTPAAMSCSTTGVWPSNAAKMRAVSLPRSQLPR
jgi:hypothetical protein